MKGFFPKKTLYLCPQDVQYFHDHATQLDNLEHSQLHSSAVAVYTANKVVQLRQRLVLLLIFFGDNQEQSRHLTE